MGLGYILFTLSSSYLLLHVLLLMQWELWRFFCYQKFINMPIPGLNLRLRMRIMTMAMTWAGGNGRIFPGGSWPGNR